MPECQRVPAARRPCTGHAAAKRATPSSAGVSRHSVGTQRISGALSHAGLTIDLMLRSRYALCECTANFNAALRGAPARVTTCDAPRIRTGGPAARRSSGCPCPAGRGCLDTQTEGDHMVLVMVPATAPPCTVHSSLCACRRAALAGGAHLPPAAWQRSPMYMKEPRMRFLGSPEA